MRLSSSGLGSHLPMGLVWRALSVVIGEDTSSNLVSRTFFTTNETCAAYERVALKLPVPPPRLSVRPVAQ